MSLSGYNTLSRTNTPPRTRPVFPDTPSPPQHPGCNTPPRIGTSVFVLIPIPENPATLEAWGCRSVCMGYT